MALANPPLCRASTLVDIFGRSNRGWGLARFELKRTSAHCLRVVCNVISNRRGVPLHSGKLHMNTVGNALLYHCGYIAPTRGEVKALVESLPLSAGSP